MPNSRNGGAVFRNRDAEAGIQREALAKTVSDACHVFDGVQMGAGKADWLFRSALSRLIENARNYGRPHVAGTLDDWTVFAREEYERARADGTLTVNPKGGPPDERSTIDKYRQMWIAALKGFPDWTDGQGTTVQFVVGKKRRWGRDVRLTLLYVSALVTTPRRTTERAEAWVSPLVRIGRLPLDELEKAADVAALLEERGERIAAKAIRDAYKRSEGVDLWWQSRPFKVIAAAVLLVLLDRGIQATLNRFFARDESLSVNIQAVRQGAAACWQIAWIDTNPVQTYVVYRDGREIARTTSTRHMIVDRTFDHTSVHRYNVGKARFHYRWGLSSDRWVGPLLPPPSEMLPPSGHETEPVRGYARVGKPFTFVFVGVRLNAEGMPVDPAKPSEDVFPDCIGQIYLGDGYVSPILRRGTYITHIFARPGEYLMMQCASSPDRKINYGCTPLHVIEVR